MGGAIGTTANLQPKFFQSSSFSSQACLRIKQKIARAVLPWKRVMRCLREKLNLGDEDLLLVGIDEIRQLETLAGKDRAVRLISDLMGSPGRVPPPNKQLPGNLRVDVPA